MSIFSRLSNIFGRKKGITMSDVNRHHKICELADYGYNYDPVYDHPSPAGLQAVCRCTASGCSNQEFDCMLCNEQCMRNDGLDRIKAEQELFCHSEKEDSK